MIKITADYNEGFTIVPTEVKPIEEYYVNDTEEAAELVAKLLKEKKETPIYNLHFEDNVVIEKTE